MCGFRACVLPPLSCYFQFHIINDTLSVAIWLPSWGGYSGWCLLWSPKREKKKSVRVLGWGEQSAFMTFPVQVSNRDWKTWIDVEVCPELKTQSHVCRLWLKGLGPRKNYSGAESCFYTINPCKKPPSSEFALHILVWPKGIWKISISWKIK